MESRYDRTKAPSFREIIEREYKTEWVKPGFTLGSVGALVADDECVKTVFGLQTAFDIALGRGVKKGKVLYLSADYSLPEMARFIRNISKNPKIGITEAEKEELDRNFELSSLWGNGPMLDELPKIADDIIEEGEPWRLVIFDSLRHFADGCENHSEKMNVLFHSLRRICSKTGASCLVLHNSRASDTLLTDFARYQEEICFREWRKRCEKRERLYRWKVTKQNYAPDSNLEKLYWRGDDQVLVPAEGE